MSVVRDKPDAERVDRLAETGLPGVADIDWSALHDDRGLSGRIADQLADAIIDGRLAAGQRLSEPAVATAFGISRTPVREALYALERDGLIERPPRKGARVSRPTAKQALDVYVCRAYLYGLSARIAADLLTPGQFDELTAIIERMKAAVEGDDTAAYYQLNLQFHDLIGYATKNDMLVKLMAGMGRLTLRFRFMSLTVPGQMVRSLEAHYRLLELLKRRDGRAAEQTVRDIVSAAGDAILAYFFDDDSGRVSAATRNL